MAVRLVTVAVRLDTVGVRLETTVECVFGFKRSCSGEAEDRILQSNIRNLPAPPSSLIESYLKEVSFSHVALVGRGYKLDPTLLSALLQLGLPVDESVATGLFSQIGKSYETNF
ncbi:hypothetical protein Gotur_002580 [Gossypium turneri]